MFPPLGGCCVQSLLFIFARLANENTTVVLDFLVRHGHIPADAPGYLELVASLRQAKCD